MSYLVDDLYHFIINNYVDYKDCITWSRVNKYFNHYCQQEILWEKFFKQKYIVPYPIHYYESFKYMHKRCLYKLKRGRNLGNYCGQPTNNNKNRCNICLFKRQDPDNDPLDISQFINILLSL